MIPPKTPRFQFPYLDPSQSQPEVKINEVFYKNRVVVKGDPETNFLKIIDPSRAQAIALASGPEHEHLPYIIQSGSDTYLGTINSFDADGFTIGWTMAGSTTGTATLRYFALR